MKRFYKDVTVLAEDGGFRVALDGRGIRTQGGRPQIVPSAALAQAMAAEWALQGETIDTARFAFRDMADYAIDVGPDPQAARLACCLMPRPIRCAIVPSRTNRWPPASACCGNRSSPWPRRHGVTFTRVSGVMHKPQPAATLAALDRELATLSPLRWRPCATPPASPPRSSSALPRSIRRQTSRPWDAACVEEDWQAELWGKDDQAQAHRTRRGQAFAKAAQFAHLL
jgi:chaperone required for assembly of F1-ATPase